MNTDQLRNEHGISHEELIHHYEVQESFSISQNDTQIKKIPQELRKKIAHYYKTLRSYGLYPRSINKDGELDFYRLESYTGGMKKLHQHHEKIILLNEKPIEPHKIKELIAQIIEPKKGV